MLNVKSNDGSVRVTEMAGTEDLVIADLGAIANYVMLSMANAGAKFKDEVCLHYGCLARKLVDYIELSVRRIDEIDKE